MTHVLAKRYMILLLALSTSSMPENFENLLGSNGLSKHPEASFVELSNRSAKSSVAIPSDPRVKRIEWEITDDGQLEIVSMPGDFLAFGLAGSEGLNEDCDLLIKQHQVHEMLGEACRVCSFYSAHGRQSISACG